MPRGAGRLEESLRNQKDIDADRARLELQADVLRSNLQRLATSVAAAKPAQSDLAARYRAQVFEGYPSVGDPRSLIRGVLVPTRK